MEKATSLATYLINTNGASVIDICMRRDIVKQKQKEKAVLFRKNSNLDAKDLR